ncbi:MAG TPA: organomercurial lyase [Longimicrobiales bacterium]
MTGHMRLEQAAVDARLRHRIYRHFAAFGEAPGASDLAEALEVPVAEIEASLDRLAAAHAIVLAPGSRNIWMVHPFSAVPTAYPVRTAERTYWANCAWDALGIPALLGMDGETRTQCADCGEPLAFRVRNGRVEPGDAVVHFVVPPKRFWENVGFT